MSVSKIFFRLLHLLLLVPAALGTAWCVGLLWFLSQIPGGDAPSRERADAIVVLTGGGKRVEHGLELLRQDKGQWLFISGVHPEARAGEIFSAIEPGMERAYRKFKHRIVLGKEARDTRGNAAETAAWARRRGVRTLRLVTAGYHMPRSLLELRRAMPGAVIIPDPVFPHAFSGRDWRRDMQALRLIAGEYHKFLAAWLKIYHAA